MNINKKSFTLTNRINKTFQIAIANFEFATTLIFRIIQQIDLDFIMSLLMKISTTISERRIRILISVVKLITKMTQTINSKTVRVVYTIRERMKFVTEIENEIFIQFVSKGRQKLITIIYQGFLHIEATPLLATFYTLGHFDPEILGDLDAETLGDMDYVLV